MESGNSWVGKEEDGSAKRESLRMEGEAERHVVNGEGVLASESR